MIGAGERRLAAVFLAGTLAACTVQLVAPYNSELQQKASAMQAEVGAWDLTMRGNAGTTAADPRNPEVTATLNRWRGQADAMLTLAVSNDPDMVACSDAVKRVYGAIESSVPENLRGALKSSAAATQTAGSAASGCEAGIVAGIGTGIDDIETVLKYCRVPWIDDAYFTALTQNRGSPPKPPSAADQIKLTNSCLAEFKAAPQLPAGAAEAGHGRAVSALLRTLQAIVYVENRKKAAEASK